MLESATNVLQGLGLFGILRLQAQESLSLSAGAESVVAASPSLDFAGDDKSFFEDLVAKRSWQLGECAVSHAGGVWSRAVKVSVMSQCCGCSPAQRFSRNVSARTVFLWWPRCL